MILVIMSSVPLLKYTVHLLRCCAQINPQRIKDTSAVNLYSRLVSVPSIFKKHLFYLTSLFYDFDLYCLMQFALPINSTTAVFIKRRGLANCCTFATK